MTIKKIGNYEIRSNGNAFEVYLCGRLVNYGFGSLAVAVAFAKRLATPSEEESDLRMCM